MTLQISEQIQLEPRDILGKCLAVLGIRGCAV